PFRCEFCLSSLEIPVAMCMLLTGGCTYTETQMRLVDQVKRGVDLCRQAQAERSQLITQYQQMQRERLEAAFDADVRQQPSLSADWVIEHRRAYTIALDGLARQQMASTAAETTTARNLNAMDEALERIRFLQSLQLKLLKGDAFDESGQADTPAK
ncbi:MAG TPA: hypothetical protein VHP11_13615, partial [Tepidisphaeraceae bacterium]|nr:hypothetical protein [Tepidisphaeraceae bacterium]